MPLGARMVLPPPPAIPGPRKTAEDHAKDPLILWKLRELADDLQENNLNQAVRLAQMAARRQGLLVDCFAELGCRYYKLADQGPRKPDLRVIEGAAD